VHKISVCQGLHVNYVVYWCLFFRFFSSHSCRGEFTHKYGLDPAGKEHINEEY
jgi:hypothetical protein